MRIGGGWRLAIGESRFGEAHAINACTMRSMRAKLILVWLVLLGAATAVAQQPPTAEQVLEPAKAQAAHQHKNILLMFEASWCVYCRRLEKFADAPEIRPILERNFVTAHLTVFEVKDKAVRNNPGGDRLMTTMGGEAGGLPFFAFLNPEGQLIVNSNRTGPDGQGGNIGYPVQPAEIDWFMVMLRKSAPALTEKEARVIEGWLRKGVPPLT